MYTTWNKYSSVLLGKFLPSLKLYILLRIKVRHNLGCGLWLAGGWSYACHKTAWTKDLAPLLDNMTRWWRQNSFRDLWVTGTSVCGWHREKCQIRRGIFSAFMLSINRTRLGFTKCNRTAKTVSLNQKKLWLLFCCIVMCAKTTCH